MSNEKDQVLDENMEAAEGVSESEEETAEQDTVDGAEKNDADAEEKAVTKEDEDTQTRYLRLAADFQNYKRRVEKEKSDIYAFANEKIVTELLNVIDNFERSLALQGDCKDEKMLEGMKLIFKQLKDVLEKSNVKEIEIEGASFDPNFHHAVMTDNSGEFESGTITEVFQKGYLLNDKVIRPAMVKVAE